MRKRGNKTKNCIVCDSEFLVEAYRFEQAKFCSKKCYWIDKGKNKVEIVCVVCGKIRLVPKSYSGGNLKCCSSKCMGILRKGYHHSDETKTQMSSSATKRYGYTDADRTKPCAVCGKPVTRDYPSWLTKDVVCGEECCLILMKTDPRIKAGQHKGGQAIGKIRREQGLSEVHKEAIRVAKAKNSRKAEYKCEWCGEIVIKYKSDAATRKRVFCNHDCDVAWRKIYSPRGKDHPSYGKPVRRGAGRCKWIDYESPTAGKVSLQGTLELRFAKLLDAAGIRWVRPKPSAKYIGLDGREHNYSPDFQIWIGDEMLYIETKGYLDEACRHKLEAVSSLIPLRIIRNDDVSKMEAGEAVDIFLEFGLIKGAGDNISPAPLPPESLKEGSFLCLS